MKRTVLCVIVFAVLTACTTPVRAQALDDESLLVVASALNKVAAAVESAVRFKGAPEMLSEEELKRFATQHDPAMLEPLLEFLVRARRVGMYSSVLVCTRDGRIGLMEDTGCTARLDARFWDRSPRLACEFQLEIGSICATQ